MKRLILNLFEMNCVSHITPRPVAAAGQQPGAVTTTSTTGSSWPSCWSDGGFDALFLADVVGTYDVLPRRPRTRRSARPADPGQRPVAADPGDGGGRPSTSASPSPLSVLPTSTRSPSPAGSPPSTTSPRAGSAGTSSPPTCPTRRATSAYGELPAHDDRYERADEYLEVLYKLWEGSWEDDAIIADRRGQRLRRPGEDPRHRPPRQVLLQRRRPAPRRAVAAAHPGALHRRPPPPRAPPFAGKHAEVGLHRRARPRRSSRRPSSSIRAAAVEAGRAAHDVRFVAIGR